MTNVSAGAPPADLPSASRDARVAEHGEPTLCVREKKTLVTYANHHHDDLLAFWCAAPEGFQRMLVAADPHRFFVPPYVGSRAWVGVRLDVEPD